jgi:hypothetical protein
MNQTAQLITGAVIANPVNKPSLSLDFIIGLVVAAVFAISLYCLSVYRAR